MSEVDRPVAELCVCGGRPEAPAHVRRVLGSIRPDSCAPRKHRFDLPQVEKLRLGGVGVATSGHVLQAHGSDVLLKHDTSVTCRLVVAAKMQTGLVISSA